MLTAFFVIGSFWFWSLLALETILLLWFIEEEWSGWATISMIATIACLYFLGDLPLFHLIKNYPVYCAGGIGGYFVVGTLWSIAKWWFFVRRRHEKYLEYRQEFYKNHKLTKGLPEPDIKFYTLATYDSYGNDVPEHAKLDLSNQNNVNKAVADYIAHTRYRGDYQKPIASESKSRILTWMTYWPWSMVWTIINDPVRRAFKAIYNEIKVVFEKIADNIYKDVEVKEDED